MMRKIFIIIFNLFFAIQVFCGVKLDSTDNWIDLQNPNSLYLSTPITVGIKFKVSAITSTDGDIFCIGLDNTDRWAIQLENADSTIKIIYDIDDASTPITTTTNVVDGQWHSVVVTLDETDGEFVYIDGTLEGSNSSAILGWNNIGYNVTEGRVGLGIFVSSFSTYRYNFYGIISEFFISASIWDAKMITCFANGDIRRFPLQDTNLKLYLPLDDYRNGLAIDDSLFADLNGLFPAYGRDGGSGEQIILDVSEIWGY